MSDAFNLPDPLVLESNISCNYHEFIEKFNQFFNSLEQVHGLPEKEKIAIFLLAIGKESSKVFQSFNLSTDDPAVTLEVVMNRFESYCKSYKDNVVYHSCEFLSRNQLENETFDDYFQCLCDLGSKCDYSTDDKERLIRDKFVAGLRSPNIRKEIFRKGLINLGEIIEYCRTNEIKKEVEMNDMHGDLDSEMEKNEQEDEQNEDEGSVELKSEPSFHLNSQEVNVKEEVGSNGLEKGEVLTNPCLVRNYGESSAIDADMVENWEAASNEATEENSNSPIPETAPENNSNEEPSNSICTAESVQIEEAQTTNSTDDHEIITIDTSDTEIYGETSSDSSVFTKKRKRKSRKWRIIDDTESSDEENYNPTPPEKICREDEKPPVRYCQTPLNFPKRKLTHPSDSKKFHQLQLCDEKFNKFFNRTENDEKVLKLNSKLEYRSHRGYGHECLLCLRLYTTENSLNNHVRNVHREISVEEKRMILRSKAKEYYYCTECACRYKNQSSLKTHMLKKHGREESEGETDESVSLLKDVLEKSENIELQDT